MAKGSLMALSDPISESERSARARLKKVQWPFARLSDLNSFLSIVAPMFLVGCTVPLYGNKK